MKQNINDALEVYVDRRIAMGTRMYDRQGGQWGVFVSEGQARFDNIRLYAR